jgi:hypothetical protein
MQIHTRSLSAGQSLTLTASMLVLQMSVMVNPASSGTVVGDLTVGGVASTSIPMDVGQGFSITTPIPNNPIIGITISCVTGTMDIMLAVQ